MVTSIVPLTVTGEIARGAEAHGSGAETPRNDKGNPLTKQGFVNDETLPNLGGRTARDPPREHVMIE